MSSSIRSLGFNSAIAIVSVACGILTAFLLLRSDVFAIEPSVNTNTVPVIYGRPAPSRDQTHAGSAAISKTATRASLTPPFSKHAHVVDTTMQVSGEDENGAKVIPTEDWTVVSFWATWCKSCRTETPNLVALHNKYSKLGVKFVGVSLDQDTAVAKSYMLKQGMNWQQVFSTSPGQQAWNSPLVRRHSIRTIPAIFLVAPDGRVVEAGMQGYGAMDFRLKYHLQID